jgi:hypothetical protein
MTSRLVLIVLIAAACGGGAAKSDTGTGAKTDTLTRRQKDSVLAASKIPGAAGVRAAMKAADSTSAHINALDTVGQ